MTQSVKKPDMIISPKQVRPDSNLHKHRRSQVGQDFDQVYQKEIRKNQGIHFSAHASKRLESRQISLTPMQHQRLERAISQAENKGVKDSLILLNRLALIVNVKNRTVVTAMEESQMDGADFTNIDSAMIINENT
jgi:flagellar operon protein